MDVSVRKGRWEGAGAARQVGGIHRQALSLAHLSGRVADKATLSDIVGRLLVGGNAALVDTHAKYNARLWRARFLSSRRKLGRATTLQQHQDITNAIRNRDAAGAADAMRAHIETAIENLFISSDEQESFE